jgi:hypothetical protein
VDRGHAMGAGSGAARRDPTEQVSLKLFIMTFNSVQNRLSSTLLSKDIKINIYNHKFACFFFMGVKLGHSQ